MNSVKRWCVVCLLLTGIHLAHAQDEAYRSLPLEDLSNFRPQAGNWQIVGSVTMNPYVDVHEVPATTPPAKSRKAKAPEPVAPVAVQYTAGKGMLLNLNDAHKHDALLTTWEHGDIDLDLEVMLPKGSNSGIYLQGRYEVQLYDSWGVRDPSFSDIGGIYRNWEQTPGKIYSGKAPLSNASKAPGLWQKLRISFRAPRFDAQGHKIENARLVSVELNGVTIHDNVEIPLPTGGPVENNEKPLGPLMIQGDHGAVAFRHIRYRMREQGAFAISPITYAIWHGSYTSVSDFIQQKPRATGTSPDLTCEVLDVDNAYGIQYKGTLTVPHDDQYTFALRYSGGIRLLINQEQLLNIPTADGWNNNRISVSLKAGTYPFEIYNFKNASWMPPRLAFTVESVRLYPYAFQAYNSFPPDEDPVSSIYINPAAKPRLLRAFLDFKGNRGARLTHTIGVGDPSGTHYVYDLKAGNLVCVWRGDFVDATPMWHDRGDGSFKPRGAAQYMFVNQPLAFLSDAGTPFPDTGNENEYKSKGYVIDETSGRPVFQYVYQGMTVEDSIYPDDQNRVISRKLTLKNASRAGLYFKLAEGRVIEQLPDGTYTVDDHQYYIKPGSGLKPIIRTVKGQQELVTPVEGDVVQYTVIW